MFPSRMQDFLSTIKQNFEVAGFLIHLFSRSLRLQLLRQLSRWRHQTERPKVAFYQNCPTAIFITLPHLLPLAAAIALILMNTAFPRLFRDIGEDTITTLQFLGKALELMFQASIAAILMDVVRSCALTAEGLPFGSLVSYLRVTDLSYLWSLELWGSFGARTAKTRKSVALVAFITVMVVLAALVGPSGTVLLIPRAMTRDTSRVLLLLDSQDILFPSTIDTLDKTDFNADVAQIVSLDWTRNYERPVADSHSTRDLTSSPSYNDDYWASATTTNSVPVQQIAKAFPFVHEARRYRETLDSTVNTTSKQPYVRTKCLIDTYDRGTTAQNLKFPVDDPSIAGAIALSDILQSGTSDLIVHFANQSDVPGDRYSALVAYGRSDDTTSSITLTTCIVEAMWVDTSLGQLSNDLIQFSSAVSWDTPEQPELLQITDSWLESFNECLMQNNDIVSLLGDYSRAENAAGWLFGRFFVMALADSVSTSAPLYGQSNAVETDAETGLSVGNENFENQRQFDQLKEYIKHHHLNDNHVYEGIVLVAHPNWDDLDSLTRQEMVTYSSIHSYGSKPVTVRLSLAVMATYCLITMFYLVAVAWTGVTGHSWDSISELLALALHSRTPMHLENTSVGIATLSTYREMVSIRANAEDRLELMFHDDPGAGAVKWKDVEANRRY